MTTSPDLTQRGHYLHWVPQRLRFSDTDMIGHVNNVAFAALIETGRVDFTHAGMLAAMPAGLLIVMRRLELDYRAEMHWPGIIDVGSRLLRIGTTSFVIGNGVFAGDECCATSVTTLVVIDGATRRPAPVPDAVRVTMDGYLRDGSEDLSV